MNGNLIAEGWWDGITWYTATASFPQSYLAAGNNTITLTSMNDTGVGYDLLYIDWVELTYSRLFTATADLLSFGYDVTGTWKYQVNGLTSDQVLTFDVSDAGAVKEITGGLTVTVGSGFSFLFTDQVTAPTDYLVMSGSKFLSPISIVLDTPSNLQAATNGADYILLTHPAFYSDIVPLADHRASLGLRVAQIDVQDVYASSATVSPAPRQSTISRLCRKPLAAPAASFFLVGEGYDLNFWTEPDLLLPWARLIRGSVDGRR